MEFTAEYESLNVTIDTLDYMKALGYLDDLSDVYIAYL